MRTTIPKLALTVSAALALIVPTAASSQAAVRPAVAAATATGQETVSPDAIATYFAGEDARMVAGPTAPPSTAALASPTTSSASDGGADVTGLLLASFRESGDTVLASRTTVTGARASGADVLAEVSYDWTLQDADGNTFEASASDTHRFAVDPSGRVRSQRFEPVLAASAPGPKIPMGARPASSDWTAAAPTTRRAASKATLSTNADFHARNSTLIRVEDALVRGPRRHRSAADSAALTTWAHVDCTGTRVHEINKNRCASTHISETA